MKLSNIFKKGQKIRIHKVQKLEKNQLIQVIGGDDSTDKIKRGNREIQVESKF